MKKLAILICCTIVVGYSQTLGQLRLVDFSAKTASTVSNVVGTVNPIITTTSPHGLSSGTPVFIWQPWDYATDQAAYHGDFSGVAGNRGRGYFIVTVVDGTHFTLASEMYSGITNLSSYTIAIGDKAIPLTTYFVRQGPKLWLDGPINRGVWDNLTTYRAHELVTSGGTSYMSIADGNLNNVPPNASWWVTINPALIGPGTFTASLRNTGVTGKANATANPAYSALNTQFPLAWTPSVNVYDYSPSWGPGRWDHAGGLVWMMNGSTNGYNSALRIATQTEDLAFGSLGCAPALGKCGRNGGADPIDFIALAAWAWSGSMSMIYDTLNASQKSHMLDALLNGNDVNHNGWETVGNACSYMQMNNGSATAATGANYTITGAGFSSLVGLAPGSIIHADTPAGARDAICRVQSVDSDSQITCQLGFIPGNAFVGVGGTSNSTVSVGTGSKVFTIATGSVPTTPGATVWVEAGNNRQTIMQGTVTSLVGNTYTVNITNVIGGAASDTLWYIGGPVSYATWWYTHPFGFGGAKDCGLLWVTASYPSTPQTIPGQEINYSSDYGNPSGTKDASPQNNRDYAHDVPGIAIGLLTANDDLRGVRVAEQYLNYYITQHLAQDAKSRQASLSGHGTQYGPGRVELVEAMIATYLNNSLTSVPPGVLTGNYLKNIMRSYQYAWWNGIPTLDQPWESGYGATYNVSGPPSGNQLLNIGPAMAMLANLYPADTYAGITWDYFKNRRGDFGNNAIGGWQAIETYKYLAAFYDPSATTTPITGQPYEMPLNVSDIDECISAGFYCRADSNRSMMFSTTGWGTNDTQVLIEGQSATPAKIEDNYGTGGNFTILQNNGQHVEALLGGRGAGPLASGVFQGEFEQHSGLYLGNSLSFWDSTNLDNWNHVGVDYQFAAMQRVSQANNNYSYAMINFVPSIRQSTTNYAPGSAIIGSFYSVQPSRAERQIVHVKSGSGASNYVVVYDDLAIATPKQLRSYWQYAIATNPFVGGTTIYDINNPVRHTDYITTYDAVNKKVVLTKASNRLTSQFFTVAGSVNPGIAMVRDDFSEAWCTGGQPTYNPSNSCVGNYSLPVDSPPAAAFTGTYRVNVCASNDSTTCSTTTSGEWLSVHKPSTSTTDVMPTISQPICNGTGGNCTAVQIADSVTPQVVGISRQGALLTAMSMTTTHSGTARYTIAGVTGGHFTILRNGSVISSADVVDGDNSFSFTSLAGNISVGGGPVLAVNPGTLTYAATLTGNIPSSQNVTISGVGVTLDQWSAAKTASWLTIAPTSGTSAGTLVASVNQTGLAAGSYNDTITVTSTTAGITNSPQLVTVGFTVFSAPTVVTSSLPNATVNIAYSQTLAGSGGQIPYTWSIVSGSLPTGLVMNSSGVISGIPSVVGSFPFTVRLTEAGGAVVNKPLSIMVNLLPSLSIRNTTLRNVTTGH